MSYLLTVNHFSFFGFCFSGTQIPAAAAALRLGVPATRVTPAAAAPIGGLPVTTSDDLPQQVAEDALTGGHRFPPAAITGATAAKRPWPQTALTATIAPAETVTRTSSSDEGTVDELDCAWCVVPRLLF